MKGVCAEPMTSEYSSFSITSTAMWLGFPPGSLIAGDGRVWTVPWRAAEPQAVTHSASAAAASARRARQPTR